MNEINISNFLPIYPEFNEDVLKILGEKYIGDSEDANYDIYRKKEFNDKKLTKIEKKPIKKGDMMRHQIIISRFLSNHTPYNGLLVFHEPGTGKTCLTTNTIELIRNDKKSPFRGALIIMKGQGLIKNFKEELVFKCTNDRYIPQNFKNLTIMEKNRRIDKLLSEYYQFETFEMFSKQISQMGTQSIIKNYSNHIIVIDETHNIRSKEDQGQYKNIHFFLHTVLNCKIILLTGTPMRDSPDEIASLMNLILPLNNQLPMDNDFIESFLEEKKNSMVIRSDMIPEFKKYLHGRVSYLRSMRSDVRHEFVGEKVLNYFNLYQVNPSKFQSEIYRKSYSSDMSGKTGVYNNSKQASLWVYPDGSIGKDGFEKYMKKTKRITGKVKKGKFVTKTQYEMGDELNKMLNIKDIDKKLEIVSKYSAKYAQNIKILLEQTGMNHFVFLEFVEGGGAMLYTELLKYFGFTQYTSQTGDINTISKRPRFALITGNTGAEEIRRILKVQTSPLNLFGEYLSIIVGTSAVSEGYTFKNMQRIHILTPHWNFTQTDQTIARGIRFGSHDDLIKNGIDFMVKIYLYSLKINNSIDEIMYSFSEDKDISIKSIEHVLKEASFDCALNYQRNLLSREYDNYRECDYVSCNYYCDGISPEEYENPEIDISSYNIFYDSEEIGKITDKIVKILQENFKINLSDVLKILRKNYQDLSVYKAISTMISTNLIVKDNLENNCVVRNDNNYIYLEHNITNKGNFFDNFYTENIPLLEHSNFSSEISSLYTQNLPNIFNKMTKEQNNTKKMDLLRKFPIEAQEMMLELAIKSIEMNIKDVSSIREFIVENFKYYVKNINGTIVSTLLFDKNEKMRCMEEGKDWKNCEQNYEEKISSLMDEKKNTLEKNDYGYYGIIDTSTGKFSIRDVKTELSVEPEDNRKKTKGKVCKTSWTKDSLIKLVDIMKFEYIPDDEYEDKSKKELLSLLQQKKYKDVLIAFSIEEMNKKTVEDIKRILYWSNLKKEPICDRIKKWFEENNLLETVISK